MDWRLWTPKKSMDWSNHPSWIKVSFTNLPRVFLSTRVISCPEIIHARECSQLECARNVAEVFYVLFYFTPLCSSKDSKANTVKTLLAFGDDTPQYIYIYIICIYIIIYIHICIYIYTCIYIYVGTHFLNLFNFIGNLLP
jgi:hypothetical protein